MLVYYWVCIKEFRECEDHRPTVWRTRWNWWYYSGHDYQEWFDYYQAKAVKVIEWLKHQEDWDPREDEEFPFADPTPHDQYQWADDIDPPVGSDSEFKRKSFEYQDNGWAPSAWENAESQHGWDQLTDYYSVQSDGPCPCPDGPCANHGEYK